MSTWEDSQHQQMHSTAESSKPSNPGNTSIERSRVASTASDAAEATFKNMSDEGLEPHAMTRSTQTAQDVQVAFRAKQEENVRTIETKAQSGHDIKDTRQDNEGGDEADGESTETGSTVEKNTTGQTRIGTDSKDFFRRGASQTLSTEDIIASLEDRDTPKAD